MRKTRGFTVTECVIGIIILTTLMAFVGAGVAQHDRAMRRLAAVRAVERKAESAMLALQTGGAVTDQAIKVRKIAAESATSPAGGMVWVEVSTVAEGHKAALVGLVPVAAVSGKEAGHAAE